MLFLLGCLNESPDAPDVCPKEAFEDAVIDAYCQVQEECGTYQSKAVCVSNQDWTLGCEKGTEYDPEIGALCVQAIVDYGVKGCGNGLASLFGTSCTLGYDEPFPGFHGCGVTCDGDERTGYLCATPKQARDYCD